ncbi:ATP-binding protein [Kitasatospora sp. NPDC056446]|uniref:ATP-binding protein n=1 Tax=Kitasatospora sp. NPDC056446 TaxID=3345819 RepID=UPI0036800B87
MHRVFNYRTPLRTASMGVVRTLLQEQLNKLDGVNLDESRAYALRLCASEIVDNAVKHGADLADTDAELSVEAGLDTARSRLRVTVTDPRLTKPDMGSRAESLSATGGRGITVVMGYADDVGWHQRLDAQKQPTGWSVWFELDVEMDPETFGRATAEAEVQPDPPAIQASTLRLKIVSGLARMGVAGWRRPSRRHRERTAA